jgi:hypothetical protein
MMIQAGTKSYERLKKKLDILQKISTNTKIQIRFIHQRKMKGLLRLLQERAQYLQALEVFNKEVDNTVNNGTTNEVEKLVLLINTKQQEIIKDNNEAVEAAKAERDNIVADLHRVNSEKNLRKSYDDQWISFTGNRLNQKS